MSTKKNMHDYVAAHQKLQTLQNLLWIVKSDPIIQQHYSVEGIEAQITEIKKQLYPKQFQFEPRRRKR
jgi:hypothetical protein